MKHSPIPLFQFFQTLLIKKGGGLWPDDTLATCCKLRFDTRCQFHPDNTGKDKSDTQQTIITKYFKLI